MPNLDTINHNYAEFSSDEMNYSENLLKMAHNWTLQKAHFDLAQTVGRFDCNKLNSEILSIKQKSFTGTSLVTGSGLIGLKHEAIRISTIKSGVMIDANIDFQDEQSNLEDIRINILKDNGDYVKFPNGVPPVGLNSVTTNDFKNIRLERYGITIDGFADIIYRNPDPNDLVSKMKELLDNKKMQLVDKIFVDNILTPGNGAVNIITSTPNTNARFTMWMNDAIGQISDRDDKSNINHIFVMNKTTYARFKAEQDTQGNLINSLFGSRGLLIPVPGPRPGVGLVGYFDGFEIWINNKIESNYQGDVNGTLVATGGTMLNRSAILFGLPFSNAVRKGKNIYDKNYDFSADSGNFLMWQTNSRVFASETYMAGVLVDPAFWVYALV